MDKKLSYSELGFRHLALHAVIQSILDSTLAQYKVNLTSIKAIQ